MDKAVSKNIQTDSLKNSFKKMGGAIVFRNRSRLGSTFLIILLVAAVVALPLWVLNNQHHNLSKVNSRMIELERDINTSGLETKDQLQLRKDLLIIEKDQISSANSNYVSMIQNFGAMLFVLTAFFAWKNLKVAQKNLQLAEDKQLTERLAKSFENLENSSSTLRLGAIYSLTRIATEFPDEGQSIVSILASFVRKSSNSPQSDQPVSIEVQKALVAMADISERLRLRDDLEQYRQINSLEGSNLLGIVLRNLDLRNMDFRKTDLRRSNFDDAKLEGISLEEADLSFSYLGSADLSGANLIKAKLQNVNPSSSNHPIKSATFQGAILREATFTDARLFRANFSGANMRSVQMSNADLREATLKQTNLTYANLSKADLSKADLSNATITWINLEDADLHGAILKDVKYADTDSIKRAKNWRNAKYSDSLRKELGLES
jgi:uncharacterized protein YjbI with pentapeptide repeats